MSKIEIIATAPYAVTLNTGRELSAGQTAKVEEDDYTRNQIATGVVAVVDIKPETAKAARTKALDAATSSTEGE